MQVKNVYKTVTYKKKHKYLKIRLRYCVHSLLFVYQNKTVSENMLKVLFVISLISLWSLPVTAMLLIALTVAKFAKYQ